MERRRCDSNRVAADAEAAARVLAAGGIVVFPAERLYGLGVDAASERAVAALFAAKGRPASAPVPVIVADAKAAEEWVHLPGPARDLIAAFWPGPLTLALPAKRRLAAAIYGGAAELGIRVPAAELARAIARRLGRPVTATSANPSGAPAWARLDQADPELLERCGLVLDAGPLPGPPASTVVRVTARGVEILRDGAIGRDQIENAIRKS